MHLQSSAVHALTAALRSRAKVARGVGRTCGAAVGGSRPGLLLSTDDHPAPRPLRLRARLPRQRYLPNAAPTSCCPRSLTIKRSACSTVCFLFRLPEAFCARSISAYRSRYWYARPALRCDVYCLTLRYTLASRNRQHGDRVPPRMTVMGIATLHPSYALPPSLVELRRTSRSTHPTCFTPVIPGRAKHEPGIHFRQSVRPYGFRVRAKRRAPE